MSDECFAPRRRPLYGVGVRTTFETLAWPPGEGARSRTEWTWMGHWTMARAIRVLDPFQDHIHIPLRAIALAPSRWLPDPNPCRRR